MKRRQTHVFSAGATQACFLLTVSVVAVVQIQGLQRKLLCRHTALKNKVCECTGYTSMLSFDSRYHFFRYRRIEKTMSAQDKALNNILFECRGYTGMLSFDSKRSLMYNRDWLFQMPLLIAVSLAAGLLGAAFNLLRRGLWRVRASRKKPGLRILEVGSQPNLQIKTSTSV